MHTSLLRPVSRREFIQKSSLATAIAAAPLILPSGLRGANAPSKKITVGIVGCGNIADSHFPPLLGSPESIRVLAVCDVDRERRETGAARVNQAYGNNDCRAYADFRELNRRPDLDVVFICTPDHWHAIITVAALKAGKDVYCEKPLTHNIHEAVTVMAAVESEKRVLQTGSMQR
jgi:predicted dehydrogenase